MDTGRLVDARLDDATSLAVFRATLDALARPGRRVPPPPGVPTSVPPALLPVLALADLDVHVAIADHGNHAAWIEVVTSVTGAQPAEQLADADMVVALRPLTVDEVGQLRTGDAFTPEHGARLFMACGELGSGNAITVTGPGASPARTLLVDGLDPAVVEAMMRRNAAFPAGVDTWLVAADGSMVGLPRSTTVTITASIATSVAEVS